MFGLVLSGMTLDDLIDSILQSSRKETSLDFPVTFAVLTIVTWTVFYGLNHIQF
jgi:hypothetical protein